MEQEVYTEKSVPFFKTRALFMVAGAYNIGIGVFFFVSTSFGDHFSLICFAVAMFAVFGLMLFTIAASPVRYKKLIPFALLRNLAYCLPAAWYLYQGKLGTVWIIPGVIELVLLVLTAIAWMRVFWLDDEV